MHRKFALVAGTAALLSLGAVTPAQAQFIDLEPQAPQWGLDDNEVRVVQMALRDEGCYKGPISGRVTSSTKSAMRCAAEKNGATLSDPEAIARALDLYAVSSASDAMMMREAPGDVAPMPATPTDSSMMRDSSMSPSPTMMRDSSMMRDSTMMRDSSMMRDSTTMPRPSMMPDSSVTRPDSVVRDSMPQSIPPVPAPDSARRPLFPPPDSTTVPTMPLPDSTTRPTMPLPDSTTRPTIPPDSTTRPTIPPPSF